MTESWFSLKRFAVALGTVALGTAAGFTLVPMVGSYIGMMLGGFAAGLAFEDRPLLESGVSGLFAGLGALVVSKLGGGLIGIISGIIELIVMKPQIMLLVAVLSFGLSAVGAHFGNDFRDGLTKPVDGEGL
jgi:hypothetical protein